DAAVAPAAEAEAVRVGDTLLDHVVRAGQQVDDAGFGPVGEQRFFPLPPAPGAAAVVRREHDVAGAREELPLEVELVGILAVRAAVDAQERRVAPAGLITNGLVEHGVHLVAVLRRVSDAAYVPEFNAGHELVVMP